MLLYITQHTDDIVKNCTAKTHVILLTNITPIKSIKKFKIK